MIVAIIQARMGSNRLPGKVMMNLSNHPVVKHVYDRTSKSKNIDNVIIATSVAHENKLLTEFLDFNSIPHHSGSENNVYLRFLEVIEKLQLTPEDHIVRITADCPLIDFNIIDQLISLHLSNDNDYTSNTLIRSYPDGLDCEILKVKTLQSLKNENLNESHLEHVTSFITENLKKFKTENLLNKVDHSNLRWTLDYQSDFDFINDVYDNLYKKNTLFTYEDVLRYLGISYHE